MKYILYILLVAVIFGLVALVDFVLGKLFPKSELSKKGQAVRLPRYSFILGILLSVLGLMAVLILSPQRQLALWLGCLVVLGIGVFLLANFFGFAIYYDETSFSYRTLTKKTRLFHYGDITGQRSFVAKSGVNILLYAQGQEIALYSAMQGLRPFLETAFRGWCEATGTDPDSVEQNPDFFSFFPEK